MMARGGFLLIVVACGASSSPQAPLISSLELLVRQQSEEISRLSGRIGDLERVTPKEFEVLHYNVLADSAGTNMQPWFMYGADITPDERKELHRRFYAAGKDGMKHLPNKGWPTWAEGVLSADRIAAVEEYDARCFKWDARRESLFQHTIEHTVGYKTRAPDIVTLAECDHYEDFWRDRYLEAGFDVIWRKRPRKVSKDGCLIAWRRTTFDLLAQGGFDFGSRLDAEETDRTCCFALLRWRRDPSVRLLVATTHLERNPESDDGRFARGFQYGVLFRELLAFAGANDAEEVPVVLTGDLNAKDCDELAGTARALVRLLESPTHPLLWSVMDAPTPPTTITEERSLRIDYLLYQSAALTLTGVGSVPRLHAPIPDEGHPSDHLPVSARLVLKPQWAVVTEDARQWLACVSGTTTVRPLSGDALRQAFTYFDKDGSGIVTNVNLEAGMQTLGFPGLDSRAVRDRLAESGCTASAGESGELHPAARLLSRRDADDRSWAMDLDQFVHVYTYSVQRSSSAMARQVEKAFAAFDPQGTGYMSQAEMRTALRRMASAPLDETRLEEVLAQLGGKVDSSSPTPSGSADALADGMITIKSFSEWMMNTYASYLRDPSLVHDSVEKWEDWTYNQ